jgi:hypothetical protein
VRRRRRRRSRRRRGKGMWYGRFMVREHGDGHEKFLIQLLYTNTSTNYYHLKCRADIKPCIARVCWGD